MSKNQVVKFENSRDFAKILDEKDNLKDFRNQFHLPRQSNGEPFIYLCGNSLGLQPKITKDIVNQELDDWATFGVEGHFNAKTHGCLTMNF